MSGTRGAVRMICKNPTCLNKSVTWRKIQNENECKSCGEPLSLAVSNKKDKASDEKAKRELKELNNV